MTASWALDRLDRVRTLAAIVAVALVVAASGVARAGSEEPGQPAVPEARVVAPDEPSPRDRVLDAIADFFEAKGPEIVRSVDAGLARQAARLEGELHRARKRIRELEARCAALAAGAETGTDAGPPGFLGIDHVNAGAEVLRVHPGSPAGRIGLRPGDRITAIEGREATSPNLGDILRSYAPGEEVVVRWRRFGLDHRARVRLAAPGEHGAGVARAPAASGSREGASGRSAESEAPGVAAGAVDDGPGPAADVRTAPATGEDGAGRARSAVAPAAEDGEPESAVPEPAAGTSPAAGDEPEEDPGETGGDTAEASPRSGESDSAGAGERAADGSEAAPEGRTAPDQESETTVQAESAGAREPASESQPAGESDAEETSDTAGESGPEETSEPESGKPDASRHPVSSRAPGRRAPEASRDETPSLEEIIRDDPELPFLRNLLPAASAEASAGTPRPAAGPDVAGEEEEAASRDAPSPAEAARRSYLGVSTRALDRGRGGLEVGEVRRGSPADEHGLRAGDVLLRLGGRDLRTSSDLAAALAGHAPGEDVSVVLERDAARREVEGLVLGTPPGRSTGEDNDGGSPKDAEAEPRPETP